MTAPRLAFYGDDLTGSTDVMEALTLRGVPTVLFTGEPTQTQRDRFADAEAIGLAGTSRSETPDWMEAHLPGAFRFLAGTGAPLCHYKVCSTFDSAPAIGSIGRALDIGRRMFGGVVPIVVGAPELRRWTVFGHLFASYAGAVHRIDRHPVMRRHPVTPMDEADLAIHLGRQTAARIGHVNQVEVTGEDADAVVDGRAGASDALLLDVADARSQRAVGRQLLRLQARGTRFVMGSSGVEYALAAAWSDRAAVAHPTSSPADRITPADRIAVVSGSVSPTTDRQIRTAEALGFAVIGVDPRSLIEDGAPGAAAARSTAHAALRDGRSVILHTASGPAGDLGDRLAPGARHAIGRALGSLLATLARDAGLGRVVVAGGDTSSHALGMLGIHALTIRTPLPRTPGSPLCRAHSDDDGADGLEIAFKGGQVGDDDYFVALRDGTSDVER